MRNANWPGARVGQGLPRRGEGRDAHIGLDNSRREKFAQEFACGKTATEAMQAAGYSDSRNSTRLTKNEEIRRRVQQIQDEGALRAEVTIVSLVQELDEARSVAIERGQAGAAVAATMGKAKLTGMIVDRSEVSIPDEFENVSVSELVEFLGDQLTEVGYSIVSSSSCQGKID